MIELAFLFCLPVFKMLLKARQNLFYTFLVLVKLVNGRCGGAPSYSVVFGTRWMEKSCPPLLFCWSAKLPVSYGAK